MQIRSFRLSMVLAMCTAYLFVILWAWAVLDVVPQYNTCSVRTQSNTTQCQETEYTLLRFVVLVFFSVSEKDLNLVSDH